MSASAHGLTGQGREAPRGAARPAEDGISVAAVICAAGSSSRMLAPRGSRSTDPSARLKKEYRLLPGSVPSLTVLSASVRAFASLPEVKVIVIAVPDDPFTGEMAARKAIHPALLRGKTAPVIFVKGGSTRRASVLNALAALPEAFPEKEGVRRFALIHDGARPWISPAFIRRIIAAVRRHPAVVPVLPPSETPKETTLELGDAFGSGRGETVYVKNHLKRSFVGLAQTPQAFAFPEILELHLTAAEHERCTGAEFTDDAEIWGTFHGSVAAVPGDPRNRKITFPEDLA